MIENYSPILQTLLGTGLTWFVTAVGALCCLIALNTSKTLKHQILDGSLGFSAGIMTAASFWSLLSPALDMAKNDLDFGSYAIFPVTIGFLSGAAFVALTQYYLPTEWFEETCDQKTENYNIPFSHSSNNSFVRVNGEDQIVLQRFKKNPSPNQVTPKPNISSNFVLTRRFWLLLIAITVHNIPEGLAVGIAFGSIGQYPKSTFASARNLAIGIAIQNFPEGLAVSLPLYSAGFSFYKSVWFGQLSGLVEPCAGLIGCLAVQMVRELQPYALGFAAGAMIFVVFDDVIPESHARGNDHLASIFGIIGFVIMMCLDVVTGPG